MTTENEQLEYYQALIQRGVMSLGSESAVCRWLGIAPGQLHYRAEHPTAIKRENIIALETLLQRVSKYREKYPMGDLAHSCGGRYKHVHYSQQTTKGKVTHWETLACNECGMMMVREMLAQDQGGL